MKRKERILWKHLKYEIDVGEWVKVREGIAMLIKETLMSYIVEVNKLIFKDYLGKLKFEKEKYMTLSICNLQQKEERKNVWKVLGNLNAKVSDYSFQGKIGLWEFPNTNEKLKIKIGG